MSIDTILDFLHQFAFDFWVTMAEMSPYLLFGFLVAGILSILIPPSVVERQLGGSGIWQAFKASVFGVPLPLCSCSVIPVSMSLHKHGASRASTVSFLLSTPQTGVDSIFVTYSLLGIVFAIFRPVAAFITGIIGGVLINIFGEKKEAPEQKVVKCTDECCAHPKQKRYLTRIIKYGFINLPTDIGRAMLIGLVIAAAMSALIPDDFFSAYLSSGILSMFVMMLLGIPVYVCATASVPIAAVLIDKGISPGAVLVFLMTGPATNAASIVTIWHILGRRTAIIYLLTVLGCALAFGLTIDYIFNLTASVQTIPHVHSYSANLLKNASAIFLFAILIYGIYRKMRRPHTAHAAKQ